MKEHIKDTRNTLSTDEKFLMDLKEKCQMTDQEWEERQRTRQEEMAAVSKALAIPSSAALQTEELVSISTLLWHQMHKHSDILGEVIIPRQKRIIASFAQAQEDHCKATAPMQTGKQVQSAGNYALTSGEIFGILKQMKETFDANLLQTQNEETENQKAYEDPKAVKEDEIAAGQEQIETKTQELAITDEKLANSKEDLEGEDLYHPDHGRYVLMASPGVGEMRFLGFEKVYYDKQDHTMRTKCADRERASSNPVVLAARL